jgi:hypothetical protein
MIVNRSAECSRLDCTSSYSSNRTSVRRSPRPYTGKIRLAVLAAAMIVCFVLGAFVHAWTGNDEVQAANAQPNEQIVVLPGDTLWNIAEEHAPRGSNIRQYIQKLKRVNGLDGSSIQAGQILILP